MIKLIFVLLLLSYFSLGQNPELTTTCSGQCFFNRGNSPTYPVGYCDRNDHQPILCNPIITPTCPNGCKSGLHGGCISNKYIQPQNLTINCPINCYNYNGVCGNIYTNYLCNPSGKGTICAEGCQFNNSTNKCTPYKNNDVCYKTDTWKCPNNCRYNSTFHRCDPFTETAICDFVEETLQCPWGCSYNPYVQRCVSSDINVVCHLEYGPICPYDCILNPTETKCIPRQQPNSRICDIISNPVCPTGCTYQKDYNACIPDKLGGICEPIYTSRCPKDYIFNVSLETCTRFNTNKICKINGQIIQYPVRLINETKDIKCSYLVDLDCESMYGTVSSCPQNCQMNSLVNKCDPLEKDVICGITLDIKCPLNYTYDKSLLDCYPNQNNVIPSCSEKYILTNIKGIYDKIGRLRCLPKWYYV